MKSYLVFELPEEAKRSFDLAQSYTIFDSNADRETAILNVYEYAGKSDLVAGPHSSKYPTVREALLSIGSLDDFDLPDFLFEQIDA